MKKSLHHQRHPYQERYEQAYKLRLETKDPYRIAEINNIMQIIQGYIEGTLTDAETYFDTIDRLDDMEFNPTSAGNHEQFRGKF